MTEPSKEAVKRTSSNVSADVIELPYRQTDPSMIETQTSANRLSRDEQKNHQEALLTRFKAVRRSTEALCAPLAIEDYGLQAMAETSPPKWHLAHTTWFFETFILTPFAPDYKPFHPQYEYLFNSYYEAVGPQFPRSQRGLLSRPTVADIRAYRAHVDAALTQLIAQTPSAWPEISTRLTLGCHHEEQHQELLLMDIKYNFSVNPMQPVYLTHTVQPLKAPPLDWDEYPGGLQHIGHDGEGFTFDNEAPRHCIYTAPYALASRLVTNGEYIEFIEAGGYSQPKYWLADGYSTAQSRQWRMPLYWQQVDGHWWQFTLAGRQSLNPHEPVCHVSFYEADAYARFRGKRLPTEAEWELAALSQPIEGNLREAGHLHPRPAMANAQFFGDTWEWTASSYAPYPGYHPAKGALGEYNGKFMANQMVLRGGSCVTPSSHIRATYRNFFYPPDRWQFSGIRLAEDR